MPRSAPTNTGSRHPYATTHGEQYREHRISPMAARRAPMPRPRTTRSIAASRSGAAARSLATAASKPERPPSRAKPSPWPLGAVAAVCEPSLMPGRGPGRGNPLVLQRPCRSRNEGCRAPSRSIETPVHEHRCAHHPGYRRAPSSGRAETTGFFIWTMSSKRNTITVSAV